MQWKHKYFEKTSKETHTNIFRSLEIEQYLQKTLRDHGFDLQDYQINFSNSTVYILLSICKIKPKKATFIKKNKFESIYFKQKSFKGEIPGVPAFKFCKNYRIEAKKKELKAFTLDNLPNKILKNLKLFTKNKQNIYLTIKEINFVNSNKNTKEILRALYKFEKTLFFSEGKRMITPFITQKNSAKLLGKFISNHLKKVKQQNFFLNFLKESLKLLMDQKFSKLQGIKIMIKGRINNSDRSRDYKIKIGKISLISINSKIDYAESTSYTTNGTLGIKVWTSEKPKTKLICFYNQRKRSTKRRKKGKYVN